MKWYEEKAERKVAAVRAVEKREVLSVDYSVVSSVYTTATHPYTRIF